MYEVLKDNPGLTAKELGKKFAERYPNLAGVTADITPAKRLSELRDAGLVEMCEPRKCRVTGATAHTWRIRTFDGKSNGT